MLYKKNVDLRSKFKLADESLAKLKKEIIVCKENFYHAQNFQKQANNKGVKPKNYIPGNKVCKWFMNDKINDGFWYKIRLDTNFSKNL